MDYIFVGVIVVVIVLIIVLLANTQPRKVISPPSPVRPEPVLETVVTRQLPSRPCADCGCPIPAARLAVSPNAGRCINCQNNFERVHDTRRKIDEGIAGTREENKHMRGQLRSEMRNRGRE